MELGWQGFALSLIQSEIDDDDEDRAANRHFLHDLSNLNFVQTPQGKLGDLLKQGRCALRDPVGVDYVAKLNKEPNDFWSLQLSVDCDIPGPGYFTRDGVILFRKYVGTEAWKPFSFFARRIVNNPPGSWFNRADPQEQQTYEVEKKVLERNGWPEPNSPFPK